MGKDAVGLFLSAVRTVLNILQYFLAYPIALGKYVNFAGFAIQRDLVATAYETEAGSPRPSFEGRANNEWVGELTAEQFVEPFKDFEEDAQAILEVSLIPIRL